jgi:hypothetical protein
LTPGQLVNAVAIALNVPAETIVQHDRNLVVAGLRTKGGRGHSAAKVTPLDAARLVTAVLGSVRVLDSVDTVLYCEQAIGTDTDGLFRERAVLAPTHNFVAALAAIIAGANTPLMFENFDEYARRFTGFLIEVRIPSFWCSIGRFDFDAPPTNSVSYTQPRSEARRYTETDRDRFLRTYCGIGQDRKIRGNSIMILGRAFLENGLAFKTTEEAMLGWFKSGAGITKKKKLAKKAK